jgi:hypothetical protein
MAEMRFRRFPNIYADFESHIWLAFGNFAEDCQPVTAKWICSFFMGMVIIRLTFGSVLPSHGLCDLALSAKTIEERYCLLECHPILQKFASRHQSRSNSLRSEADRAAVTYSAHQAMCYVFLCRGSRAHFQRSGLRKPCRFFMPARIPSLN